MVSETSGVPLLSALSEQKDWDMRIFSNLYRPQRDMVDKLGIPQFWVLQVSLFLLFG